ncbi:MAG: hypothetical protein ABIH46_14255 [Chloroflexota bacterium]
MPALPMVIVPWPYDASHAEKVMEDVVDMIDRPVQKPSASV